MLQIMKKLFKYLVIVVSIGLVSCSIDETRPFETNEEAYIEYIARPTSFDGYNVSSKSTKAAPTSPSELDNRIVSAYFLVFDADGKRMELRTAKVENNAIVPEILYHNSKKGPLKVCYLANVRESYADSLENFSMLSQKDYAYKINYAAADLENNILGVPVLDGVQCFPMIGVLNQSYENGQLSGLTSDGSGKYQMTIPLKRLFAKVYFEINWENQTNTDNLLGDQGFKQNYYILNNLPKYVLLNEVGTDGESDWVKDDSYFMEPIIVDKSEETSLLDNIEFTIYIPEYALLPESDKVEEVNNISGITDTEKQKYKPLLYDTSKNPIYLTIDGIVQSTDFVNVPVTYSIYLGKNAFDSFSLIRNNQYNNIMTIYGTGDAILGKDDRVEALYHNLADPNNTGTDNPANCYIIGRPGRYLIPTYKGNSSTMLSGIDISKKEIHSDGNNTISNMKYIADSLGRNWVMFDVNMTIASNSITDLPAIEDGNTVLEFKDASGNTVWSWHLWFTSGGVLGSEWGAISSETYNTNATMMNRNLGAPGAGDIGVYYQWGDKDPYFTTSEAAAGYYGGTLAGEWSGTAKSVTDPCPPGYMMPSSNVWSETPNEMTTWGIGSFTYEGSPLVIYPYSSYLTTNNELFEFDEIVLTNSDGGTKIYSRNIKLSSKYYLRLQYSGTKSGELGLVWSTDDILYYSTETYQIDEDYKVEYSTDGGSTWSVPPSYLMSILNRLGLKDAIATILGELKEAKEEYKFIAPSDNEGYDGLQVRCVKETSATK